MKLPKLAYIRCAAALMPAAVYAPCAYADSIPARQAGRPIRLSFANVEVTDVLQAIGRYYRANLVFPQVKKPITLNSTASTLEEALRIVTAAAELAYRQVGDTYVVSTPAGLRQAVEPFGERARLKLNNLPADQAVKLLEGALPYLTARPAGTQVLVIGAPEDVAQARALLSEQDPPRVPETQVNEVVNLQFAPASQVAAMITSMFPAIKADAVGQADKPGGSLGLSGPRSAVEGAREAIRTVDVPTAPREPDKIYRVYNIRYSSAPLLKDFMDKAAPDVSTLIGPEHYAPLQPGFRPLLGTTIGTSTLSGSGGGAGGVGGGLGGGVGGQSGGMGGGMGGGLGGFGQAEQRKQRDGDRAKTLVLSGTPAQLDAAFQLLQDIDIKPKQVMIDVKVVDTSPERAENLGLQWSWQPFGFLENPAGTAVSSTTGQPAAQSSRPVSFGQFSRVPWGFNAILNALITRKEAKLLADPRIQTVDNEDANIFIGDTIRARIAQATSLGGQTVEIVEFPVGIILLVRPRVNGDGNITMRVHPVVSTITAVDANNVPQTSSREAETTVMVKDGETVVIGGLIRDELSRTISEVPLLSKLPLIGELFRNRSTNHRHSEILVFITPHIVP